MAAEGIPFIHSANQSRRCPAGEGLLGDTLDDFSELGRVLKVMGICSPKACYRKLLHLGVPGEQFRIRDSRSREFHAEVNAALSEK